MALDSFGTRDTLTVDGSEYAIYRLDRFDGSDLLPFALKVLAENLLRREDGRTVTAEQIQALITWDAATRSEIQIPFTPARVLMQDFTGVPCLVDLAAIREAMAALGGDPAVVNPHVPVELVIDHSVIVDHFGRPDAFERNVEQEYQRNRERYEFLRWGQQAFTNLRVVPPKTGIVHQVNIEHLARVIFADDGLAYPDTLVGTDSHTTMVNGLGVLGWGVGGIEAEAAMLGHPISLLLPLVVGVRLTGQLPEGSTATDLVLTIAEMLRAHGVVGAFVEFCGPSLADIPVPTRATIGNMSPEYGCTAAVFPIDTETLAYLRQTGRSTEHVALVESYAKVQGLWHEPDHPATYSETLELDLCTVEPSIAGPKRPQDRIPLEKAPQALGAALHDYRDGTRPVGLDEAGAESFPASDPLAISRNRPSDKPRRPQEPVGSEPAPRRPVEVTLDRGQQVELDHGAVVIAAITSCTNTSNPQVMLAAALLARNAVAHGLRTKPWVKTSLAPGSRVVMDYFQKADLLTPLHELGFDLVGYGCTTCIGNSGPLPEPISHAIRQADLAVCSVLSGNRNFEGRIHPETKLNYLASPPLVVAYALAGSLTVDLTRDPLGTDQHGHPVYLQDLWPTSYEINHIVADCVRPEMFHSDYADVFTGDTRWQALATTSSTTFAWDATSTYVRRPPYFDDIPAQPAPLADIDHARVLAWLGESVTTDHISPAGAIKRDSPAGQYLQQHGVEPREFNSYGSRRGNHEVMIRGTFANIRLRNQLAPGTEGGLTRHLPDGEVMTIYDAAQRYATDSVPLLILAGAEYGAGSSRDWAAKGTALLGVKAVIAESYERIHRSNLIGMGVLPLQFLPSQTAASLGLTGQETFSIRGLTDADRLPEQVHVTATTPDEACIDFNAAVRIDTPSDAHYYRHGGILPAVLRQLADP